MIRGFARLPDRSRATLTIVGDGDCRRSLEGLVDQLRVRETVTFKGTMTDVSPALRQADVFVSTSLSEGMSNALLEAMSFGVMPLVSRVSGVADIVEEGRSGLLFAAGDLDAFATKLAEAVALAPDVRDAFGSTARAAVADRFGIDQVAAQHVVLYQDLLRASP
jgi:glycosyltransferase involved in cell wall biosynthesis